MNETQITNKYVGTIVGESTTREFRIAVAESAVKEQDIVAVDSELRDLAESDPTPVRVWAKVLRIERINPLFPQEAGHELAATETNPFDTVLSLSREMISAVCQVLGYEPIAGGGGKLDQLRYPAKPATQTYRPQSDDVARIVIGDLNDPNKKNRALDIATLANRKDIDVLVDGHAIVSRHLAILAMTGAGKSVTARRIIEELANKNYPILIFDPHGEYTGLKDVPTLKDKVRLFFAKIDVFELDTDDARRIITGLSGEELTAAQLDALDLIFGAAKDILGNANLGSNSQAYQVLHGITHNTYLQQYGLSRNLFGLSYIADAAAIIAKAPDGDDGRESLANLGLEVQQDGRRSGTFSALARKFRRAGLAILQMERINRMRAGSAEELPGDRSELVKYGQISVVSLAGYSEQFKATLFSYIADYLFQARVQNKIPYQFLMVMEEAHNFVPGRSDDPSIERSIAVTKQIAQEGRKFGVGLVLISQRPSRLDETTLSMCNSFVIMRMVNPADQNFVRRVVESLGEDEAANLPNLDIGEALLSGQMINFPVLVKMKEPASKGEREESDAFVTLEKSRKEELAKSKS